MNREILIRIEKHLANEGLASRREAKDLILSGQIKLNGKTVQETGIKINPQTDILELATSAKKKMAQKVTVAVHKPRNVICGDGDGKHKTVFDVFPNFKNLNTVGRLDKDSEGLLLLSNDGLITKAITDRTHPSEKEYVVTVREDVIPWMIKKFEQGIKIEGGYVTLPAKATKVDKHTFAITLREGKKHQIRRMANAVGLTITSLKRIRINSVFLDKLRPGQSRRLTNEEVASFKKKVTH